MQKTFGPHNSGFVFNYNFESVKIIVVKEQTA